MPNLLNVEANQRVDFADFTALANSPSDHAKLISEYLLTNPSGTRSFVVSGFATTNPTASQISVVRGTAILARKDGGQTKYGYVAAEGDSTKIVDIAAYANGTYGVYIRFEFQDGDNESRIFWNSAGLGSEFAAVSPTRLLPNWSVRVEASLPGAEWLQIASVVKTAGPSYALTDLRNLYFEGVPSAGYANPWGTGNDRNANRSTYGVHDFQTFTGAMRTKLEELTGGAKRWWEATSHGVANTHKAWDFWADGVVLASDLTVTGTGGLGISVTSGTGYAVGVRTYFGGGTYTLTASKDTYIDLKADGTLQMTPVTNGAAEPALLANGVRIAKAITDAGTVTNTYSYRRLGLFADQSSGARYLGARVIASSTAGPVFAFQKARGSSGLPLLPADGDTVGSLSWQAWNTGTFSYATTARIDAVLSGTTGTNSLPTHLSFSTAPDGSVTVQERLRIQEDGSVCIADAAASFAPGYGVGRFNIINSGSNAYLLHGAYSSADAEGGQTWYAKSRGTPTSPTAVLTSDVIHKTVYRYFDGSFWQDAAVIEAYCPLAPVAGSSNPGGLLFGTTAQGSQTPTTRYTIDHVGNHRFYVPTASSFYINNPLGGGFQYTASPYTSAYSLAITQQNAGVFLNTSIAGRAFYFQTNSAIRAIISDAVSLTAGPSAWTGYTPACTLNVPTFFIRDAYALLGPTAGNSKALTDHEWLTESVQILRQYAYRHVSSVGWSSASHYLHFQTDATPQSFIRFAGDAVWPAVGTHVGFGVGGSLGAAPVMGVTDTTVWLNSNARFQWDSPNTTQSVVKSQFKPDGYTGKLIGGDGTNVVRYMGVVAGTTPVALVNSAVAWTMNIPASTLRSGSAIRVFAGVVCAGSGTAVVAIRLGGTISATCTISAAGNYKLEAVFYVGADPSGASNIQGLGSGYGTAGLAMTAINQNKATNGVLALDVICSSLSGLTGSVNLATVEIC